MKTIVIPYFENRISPRLDYAENFKILTIDKYKVVKEQSIKIITKNRLEKINRIILLNPDLIICNGLTERCYVELTKAQIKVMPWNKGEVESVLKNYLSGFMRGEGNHKFGNKIK